MVQLNATISKYANNGEKTGWTYIQVAAEVAGQLKPGNKKEFRVKGYLDDYKFERICLLPVGEGNFIMPLNATIRKAIKKRKGDAVLLQMEIDESELEVPADLLECMQDEPDALTNFNALTKGNRNYFINWINSAKGEATRAKRIAQSITAFSNGWNFGEMVRYFKNNRALLE